MKQYKECPTADQSEKLQENCKFKTRVMCKWLKKNSLFFLTTFSVIFGVAIGIPLRKLNLSETTIILISYPGELYMRALKLLILPLVISSLISGTASLNAKLNGKIALRTFTCFFLTSCFNSLLGVLLAVLIRPGHINVGISVGDAVGNNEKASVMDSLLDLGRNVISDNIFQATFQQAHTDIVEKINYTIGAANKTERNLNYKLGVNNIGIVFFCITFGGILGTIGSKGNGVKEFFSTIFDVVMKMVRGVIWMTPVGLFSIIAGKLLSVADVLLVITQLGWFVATIIVGVYLYQLVILQLIYLIILRKNPFKYYFSFMPSTITAFAAASAAAALPLNFDILDYKLKLNPAITRFVMPIGCNINMDGTAMFLSVSTIFMGQMSGFPLNIGTLVTIWLTCTIISFSSASIPSAALVLVQMILNSIGISQLNLPLLFAVDWLVDRFRTTNNMLGDCYTVAIVNQLSRNELKDEENLQELPYKTEENDMKSSENEMYSPV
ncbi:unnamed protein product [Phyllotreta striolata]|uniref:Amino acid transporter n=1 Tax=Phyllotreta striolata TaxID=444603 RepID=A0A9N9XMM8_PHYSR|nr:unnamed protein product [Phyllotreta striolata]